MLKVIQANEHVLHVALSGNLDGRMGSDAETVFLQQVAEQGRHVLVDLTEVGFISSRGLRMLMRANRAQRTAGKRLVLVNPTNMVAEILDMTGLTEEIPVVADPDRALELLER